VTELETFGRGWWTGHCPLPDHDDRTPSFYVYEDNRAHCYGCGFHGDVIDLYQAIEGLDSPRKAVLELAVQHGIRVGSRTEGWRRWQGKKSEVLDVAEELRKRAFRRRSFKVLMLPYLEAIEDDDERTDAIHAAWMDWQNGLKRIGR